MKGHLRRRGNTWELRAYVGIDPIANRQQYLTRTFRGGKREADEALARCTTEVSGGATPPRTRRSAISSASGSTSPTTTCRHRLSAGTSGPSGATSPQRWARCHWLAFGPPSSTAFMHSSGRRVARTARRSLPRRCDRRTPSSGERFIRAFGGDGYRRTLRPWRRHRG